MSSSTSVNIDEIIQEIIATYSNGITAELIPRIFECRVDDETIQLRFNEAVVLKGLYRYILADFHLNGARQNENILRNNSLAFPVAEIYDNFVIQRQIWERHLESDDSFRRIVYRHLDEMAVPYDASRIRPIIRQLIINWDTQLRNRL